ncbi:MAG: OstA-like protein [Sphingobacteriaceae bacterium]
MKKLLVTFLLLSLGLAAQSQQKSRVQLVSSLKVIGMPNVDLLKVLRPVFSQEGSTLSADSALFNQAQNTFDAFGNVVITQTTGTKIYADSLNYNGNTKIALLTHRVRMVDGDAVLTTENLTYNLGTRIGTYTGGGKIVNGKNVLVSKNGYYFANTRDAYFRYDVLVTSPNTTIKSDTLRYNSGSKISYFYGPTHIKGKDDTLYTENGEYNTAYDQAKFGKNNLYTQGSKSLTGDSLFYDGKRGYGRAVKNIVFIDTAPKIILKGDLGIYKKADESTLVTQNAYVILSTESDSTGVDSIWMTADTLLSRVTLRRNLQRLQVMEPKNDLEIMAESEKVSTTDTGIPLEDTKNMPEKASPEPAEKPSKKEQKQAAKAAKKQVQILPAKVPGVANLDTVKTRILSAYHHVKVFKSDLQAKADSLYFNYSDSIMRCYKNPIVWTQGSQMSADTIYLQLKDKQLHKMLLSTKGFIANTEGDSTKFNQVRGKLMTGYFKNNTLERLFADGNSESVYYLKEEDGSYSGMNRSVSSRIKILFGKNSLNDIYFIKKPEMVFNPMDKIEKDKELLDGFIWKPKERPLSKESIIPNSYQPAPKKSAPTNVQSKPSTAKKDTKKN